MNRRAFFSALSGIAVSIQTTKASLFGWGYMSAVRCCELRQQGVDLHVFFNGEDVNGRCFEADDAIGYVGLFKQHDGHFYLTEDRKELAREWLHGRVEFRKRS